MSRHSGEPSLFEILNRARQGDSTAAAREGRRGGLFGRKAPKRGATVPSDESGGAGSPSSDEPSDPLASSALRGASTPPVAGGSAKPFAGPVTSDAPNPARAAETEPQAPPTAREKTPDSASRSSREPARSLDVSARPAGRTPETARGAAVEPTGPSPRSLRGEPAKPGSTTDPTTGRHGTATPQPGRARRPRPADPPVPGTGAQAALVPDRVAIGDSEPRDDFEPTLWTWLNRTVVLRRATALLCLAFAVLIVAGAYLAGGGGAEGSSAAQERLFMRSYDDAPWAPSEGLNLRKQRIRSIQSTQPVSPPDSVGESGAADDKTYAVVVSQSPRYKDSEQLAMYLDKQGVGAPVDMDSTRNTSGGKPLFRVYFGPFATKAEADACLEKVRRIPNYAGNTIANAMVLPGPFSGEGSKKP